MTPLTNRYGAIFRRNAMTGGRVPPAHVVRRRGLALLRRAAPADMTTSRRVRAGRFRIRRAARTTAEPIRRRAFDDQYSPGARRRGSGGASVRATEAPRAHRAPRPARSRWEAILRILLQQHHDRARQIVGTSLRRCCTGIGRSEMCFTSIAGVLPAVERRLAREHLVAEHAERIQVAAAVDLAVARRLLRRHVGRRADRHACGRQPAVARWSPWRARYRSR